MRRDSACTGRSFFGAIGTRVLVGSLAFFAASCGARNGPTPEPQAADKAAKGASWVAGCRLQGCGYGAFCNDAGFCEERECAKGCPSNTVCNEGLNRCQTPPPPPKKGDMLPQDDKLQNMPTMN